MAEILIILWTIAAVALGIPVLYLLLLSILALFARSRPDRAAPTTLHLCLVIPAHNEELTIADTIRSGLAAGYPRDRFRVIVVADNCTDNTATVARSAGAIVMERTHATLRGKGHALRWCFDALLNDTAPCDGIIVVDADSRISENFLRVVNACLNEGARVLQCSDLVQPQPGVWSSEATRIGFLLYNYVRPLGRRVLGFPPGLRGNGMAFSASVLREVPWQAYTRVEDLEYGLILLLHGVHVTFAPEAVVLATMPAQARNAETQRARWEGGRIPVIRRYAPRLLVEGLRHASPGMLDALLDLVTPALVNMIAVALVMTAISVVLGVAVIPGLLTFGWIWAGIACAGVAHMGVGLYAARADVSLYRSLLHIPRYVLWKLFLYARLTFRRKNSGEWIRTTRESRPAGDGSR